MPRKERVNGPYRHRNKWRVIYVSAAGTQDAHSFATQGEAERAAEAMRAELRVTALTVGEALEMYESYLARRGNKSGSIATTLHRLRSMLPLDDEVSGYTRKSAELRYAQLAGSGVSVDTHRNTLNQCRTFWRWLEREGHVRGNPWLDVEPVGRRRRGKEQLTIDEARRLVSYSVDRRDVGSTACLMALACGLRAGEICALRRRDIDDGGRVLWVRGTKTASARRRVAIPGPVGEGLGERLPVGVSRHVLLDAAQRTMREAGVTVVTLHGLRGTHATLAASVGQTPLAVAQALGHAGTGVTERHYIKPGTVDAVRQETVLRVIAGGK